MSPTSPASIAPPLPVPTDRPRGTGMTGACVNTQTSTAHCGACGQACGSGEVCVTGTCQTSCALGQSECSGTCRDLNTDRLHCGACDTPCPAGQVCTAGACAVTCGAGAPGVGCAACGTAATTGVGARWPRP